MALALALPQPAPLQPVVQASQMPRVPQALGMVVPLGTAMLRGHRAALLGLALSQDWPAQCSLVDVERTILGNLALYANSTTPSCRHPNASLTPGHYNLCCNHRAGLADTRHFCADNTKPS